MNLLLEEYFSRRFKLVVVLFLVAAIWMLLYFQEVHVFNIALGNAFLAVTIASIFIAIIWF